MTTAHAPHIRDATSVRGVMRTLALALAPAAIWAVYNTGHRASLALDGGSAPGWRGGALDALGIAPSPDSPVGCALLGLLWLGPLFGVILSVGWLWQTLFERVRGRESGDGLLAIALLLSLSLPPALPLWQGALAMSFGLVLAREVFGGAGRNFVHPALVALAFVYFAYPASISELGAWVAIDGVSGATPLAQAMQGGLAGLERGGVGWWEAFSGSIGGSPGETSTVACLLGAGLLLARRVVSWRIPAGGLVGLIVGVEGLPLLVGSADPALQVPWYWHAVLGSFAFGLVFIATDPVTSASTNAGRWIYGGLIGLLVALVRLANPAYIEGTMLAILLGNVSAPLIDHAVVRANVRRRRRRRGG